YLRAYRALGPLAGRVGFAAVNVNQYHAKVQDVAAYSWEQQLAAIPGWHVSPALPVRCRRCGVTTTSPSRHPTPTLTSCTPRRCISSIPWAGTDFSLPQWSSTPSRERPTF